MMLLEVQRSHVAFIILLTFSLLCIQNSFCKEIGSTKDHDTGGTKNETSQVPAVKNNNENNTRLPEKSMSLDSKKDKSSLSETQTNIQSKNQSLNHVESTELPVLHNPALNAGAFKRAFYVFLGLSVIVLAYFVFRSSRLRTGPAQMVRKYGVLAHKQDLEMRPLPLDEDDDDETTVFDASGLSLQSQKTAKA